MQKFIIMILVVAFAAALSGCAGMCNANGIGISAGAGMNSGSAGVPGLVLAGAQIGACGAYKIVNLITDSSSIEKDRAINKRPTPVPVEQKEEDGEKILGDGGPDVTAVPVPVPVAADK